MALIESQNLSKPHNLNHFIGKNYELAVNQSLQSLLDSLHERNPNLSVYTSVFQELMQAKPDPPLETIWVFSRLNFHGNNSPKDDPFDELSALKDLFQSITACSASCSSSKSVALIAPVMYRLCRLVVDLKEKDLGFKKEKKVRREIKSFVDVVLGYLNCCEGPSIDEGSDLIRPLEDLISVWIQDEVEGNGEGGNGIKLFFPLLGDQIIEWMSEESGDVNSLAGCVIAEAFLLKLCLKFDEGNSRKGLQNELRTWAVCSITGFGNFYLFDMLVKMLLEPRLPVASLLNSEDETFLRDILYDAVILPNYSFLQPNKVAHLPIQHIKNSVVARLMITYEAIEFFRGNGDHTRAISYTNAFSGSHVPSEIVKCITSGIHMEEKATPPKGSSPKVFLKWLVNLEGQGIRLFDNVMSKYYARLVNDDLKAESVQEIGSKSAGESDMDISFFIDKKGNSENENKDKDEDVDDGDEDEEMDESMNAVFMAAAHTMQSDEGERGKKRKDARDLEDKGQVKFQRHDLLHHSGSLGPNATSFNDSSSGNEIEDPDSDKESE